MFSTSNRDSESPAVVDAVMVESQMEKIKIPRGLRPGDSFIVTPENGRAYTVIVPENCSGGSYLEVMVPDEPTVSSSSDKKSEVKISKAAIGAAVAGGVIGMCVLGPVSGCVLAAGAAYAATRKNGRLGDVARKVGNSTYSGMEKASSKIEELVIKEAKKRDKANKKESSVSNKL
jgi:hypothetical protein